MGAPKRPKTDICDAREHLPGTVWQAQELYTVQRRSLNVIAQELGVSRSQLSRWNKKYGWNALRDTISKARAESSANFELALDGLLKLVLEKGDPQTAFAVGHLVKVSLARDEAMRKLAPPPMPEEVDVPEVASDEGRVDLLEDAVNRRIGQLLAKPEAATPESVADIGKMLTTIRGLRADIDVGRGVSVEWQEGGEASGS